MRFLNCYDWIVNGMCQASTSRLNWRSPILSSARSMFSKRVCLFRVLHVLSKLTHVLPSGMAGFHNFWSPRMCVCLAPNFPRHLLWQVCPWLTRYHRHRLCPLLIFYALSVMKNMKNRFFCSQYSVQWISWNIDVTSFCSQYYEIYKYRFTTLCSPLCSLPEDIWDDIAMMPLFWCQTFYKGIGGAIFFVFFLPYLF